MASEVAQTSQGRTKSNPATVGAFMYGKAFEQTFTGSMVGSGPVAFSVWFYVVANTDKDHYVELNPNILSAVIGADKADIQKAIDGFCSPDPDSRCSEHEGRKLIKEGQYLYFVTGHERFRNTRNGDDRREYMRNYMAERRKVLTVNKVNCKPQLAHTEAEADTKAEAIYKEYPRKVGKADALRAIRRALAKLDFPTLLEKTRQYAA